MIDEVMRVSTVFASMMAYAAFAFAVLIGVAGAAERGGTACHGCLDTRTALARRAPLPEPARSERLALRLERPAL